MPAIADGCLQIRGLIVHSYALLEEDGRGVTLIDGGFLGDRIGKIEGELRSAGRSLDDVNTILLTHGHIDHTRQIARLRKRTSAAVFAPAGEEEHIAGKYPYRGLSRICGFSEALARTALRYRPPAIDGWFRGGDKLDFWGGLEVISLPGHTRGHCGFYSKEKKLLFAADLLANFLGFPRLPPPWFNVDSQQVRVSIRRANQLDLSGGVLLSHCHAGSPREHREDLRILAERFS